MFSMIPINVPEKIDESTSFTDILGGMMLDYSVGERARCATFAHAALMPYARDFFMERMWNGASPTEVLESALQGTDPLIPGCSVASTPIWEIFGWRTDFSGLHETLRFFGKQDGLDSSDYEVVTEFMRKNYLSFGSNEIYKLEGQESMVGQVFFNPDFSVFDIRDENRRLSFSQMDFQRGFGQVLAGGLEASVEMGRGNILRVPSFDKRAPNYLDRMALDFLGEGLKRGTLLINGDAGDYLGKHSTGGTIVVTGNTGDYTGDVSRDVTFYIGGNVQSISQSHRDTYWVVKGVHEDIQGGGTQINLGRSWVPKSFGNSTEEWKETRSERLRKLGERNVQLIEHDSDVSRRYDEVVNSLG